MSIESRIKAIEDLFNNRDYEKIHKLLESLLPDVEEIEFAIKSCQCGVESGRLAIAPCCQLGFGKKCFAKNLKAEGDNVLVFLCPYCKESTPVLNFELEFTDTEFQAILMCHNFTLGQLKGENSQTERDPAPLPVRCREKLDYLEFLRDKTGRFEKFIAEGVKIESEYLQARVTGGKVAEEAMELIEQLLEYAEVAKWMTGDSEAIKVFLDEEKVQELTSEEVYIKIGDYKPDKEQYQDIPEFSRHFRQITIVCDSSKMGIIDQLRGELPTWSILERGWGNDECTQISDFDWGKLDIGDGIVFPIPARNIFIVAAEPRRAEDIAYRLTQDVRRFHEEAKYRAAAAEIKEAPEKKKAPKFMRREFVHFDDLDTLGPKIAGQIKKRGLRVAALASPELALKWGKDTLEMERRNGGRELEELCGVYIPRSPEEYDTICKTCSFDQIPRPVKFYDSIPKSHPSCDPLIIVQFLSNFSDKIETKTWYLTVKNTEYSFLSAEGVRPFYALCK